MLLGKVGSYSTAVMCSVVLHAGLVVLLVSNWVPEESERKFIAPKYIDARLLQLKATEKPKKDNSAAKKKAAADAKKRADARKKADAKKKADARKKADAKRKADAKKKADARKKADAKKAAEAAKKHKEEQQRKALEDDLFSELDDDLEGQIAENDEQIAGAYSDIISQRVSGNWSRPPSARRNMEVELLIKLVPTGRVVGVTVAKSSGNAAFDRSAEQAVLKANSFPELKNIEPRVFEKYFRNFRMVFRPEDLRL